MAGDLVVRPQVAIARRKSLLAAASAGYFDIFGGYPPAVDEIYLVDTGFLNSLPSALSFSSVYYTPLHVGCTSYHLGIELENTTHPVMVSDADFNSEGQGGINCPAVDGTDVTVEDRGFNGAITRIYDVRP